MGTCLACVLPAVLSRMQNKKFEIERNCVDKTESVCYTDIVQN